MKTINFKKIKILLSFNFILGIHGFITTQTVDVVYSQPVILQDTWYLIEGEINGFIIPAGEGHNCEFAPFGEEKFLFKYGNCFEFFTVPYTDLTNNNFSLLNIDSYTNGNCTDPEELGFIDLHNSFYFELPLDTNGTPKNPFTYTIEDFGNYRELTIQNPEGDWLFYGGIVLSTPSFSQNSFTLYPNPVKEVLQINNSSNQPVTAIIYDINGKKLQAQSLENNLSSIHVKALKQGLYFVVFESGTGERVGKKFVKK